MYAILGITGQVGSWVATYLKNQQLSVKALVRTEARVKELSQQGIQAVQAELHDVQALTHAFTGTDGVFVMTPPLFGSEDPLDDHTQMLEALATALRMANPPKVVYLSSVGAQLKDGTGAIRKLYDMEKTFQRLPMPTVSIRAAWFMENFLGNTVASKETGKLMSFLTPSSKRIPMVSVRDIGGLVANLLQQNWEGHRIIELSGPCEYSADDVAMILGFLLNQSVTAQSLLERDYETTYQSFGLTPKAADMMAEMNRGFNSGHIVFEGQPIEQVEGEMLLEDCLKSHVASVNVVLL